MLSLPEEERKFNRSIETGRPSTTLLGFMGEPRVSVRALGKLSSAQFTMIARPSEYSNSWLHMDEARGQDWRTPDFFGDNPEYQDLEQRIMKEGVRRPVVLGSRQRMLLPGTSSNPNRIVRGNYHPVMDGHHRAYFAIKHGLPVPTVVVEKMHG